MSVLGEALGCRIAREGRLGRSMFSSGSCCDTVQGTMAWNLQEHGCPVLHAEDGSSGSCTNLNRNPKSSTLDHPKT